MKKVVHPVGQQFHTEGNASGGPKTMPMTNSGISSKPKA
jgi:hypothetical protein